MFVNAKFILRESHYCGLLHVQQYIGYTQPTSVCSTRIITRTTLKRVTLLLYFIRDVLGLYYVCTLLAASVVSL